MLEREYCIEEQAPAIYAFLIVLCAIVVVACSCFLLAVWGAQVRMDLRTDFDVLGDWRESEVHLNADLSLLRSTTWKHTEEVVTSHDGSWSDDDSMAFPDRELVKLADVSDELTASIFMVTELVSVDAEVIRRINSVGYRRWFEVVRPVTPTEGAKRDVNVFGSWDFRFPARSWKRNSYRIETVLSPLTALRILVGQSTSNRPLLCATDRSVSFLSHSHPSQPIQLPWRGGSTFLRNVAKFNL